MKYFSLLFVAVILCFSPRDSLAQSSSGDISINGRSLSAADVEVIKHIYGVQPKHGSYWYDAVSGAFGNIGGPALGVMYPGHDFGKLASDVSKGSSGVFINGRELQQVEAIQAAQLFGYARPQPGRYWLLANGNLGVEGNPIPLGNIYVAIRSSRRTGTGDNFWSSGLYGAGNYYTGKDGKPSQGYVSVPGYGPVSFGMD